MSDDNVVFHPEENEIEVELSWGGQGEIFTCERTEASVWERVGEFIGDNYNLVEKDEPLHVDTADGSCRLFFTGDKDRPIRKEGGIPLKKGLYKAKHFTRVDVETNMYEFYKLVPNTMGELSLDIGGSFGRIGASDRDLDAKTVIRPPFNSCLFWPVYYTLLSEGYDDQSELVEEDEEEEVMKEIDDEDPAANELWEDLHNASEQVIMESLDFDMSTGSGITRKLVSSCKLWLKKMVAAAAAGDIDAFNKALLKLISLSKRRIDKYHGMTVESYLAKKVDDPEKQEQIFQDIMKREEELILAMEAMVSPEKKSGYARVSPFGDVDVRTATEEEIAEVQKMVEYSEGDAPGDKHLHVEKVYRVVPGEQRKRFEEHVASMKDKTVKLLWHGARNSSYCSIIMNSLSLSFAANGMFSAAHQGLYLAKDPKKSAGYTDGGRWSGGGYSKVFYLAVFEAAYGTPWFVDGCGNYTRADIEAHNANCIHALRHKCGLFRDEYIFPYEEALCMKYIVKFCS